MPGKKESEEQRREQILSAALKVALREHLEELTMRQVAEEAHLSSGLVFFHFKSKDALLLALLDWFMAELNEEWAVPSELSPREKLVWLLQQEIEDVHHDPHVSAKLGLFLSYWSMGLHNPEIKARIIHGFDQARKLFMEVAQELIDSEPVRFQGVTPKGIASVIFSLVQGHALQTILSNGAINLEEVLKAQAAMLNCSDQRDPAKSVPDKV